MKPKPLVRELLLALPDGTTAPTGLTAVMQCVHRAAGGAEDWAGPVLAADGQKAGQWYATLGHAEKPRRGRPPGSVRKLAAALAWANGYAAGLSRGRADEQAAELAVYDLRNVQRARQTILADALLLGVDGDGADGLGTFFIARPAIGTDPDGALRISGHAARWTGGGRVSTGQLDIAVRTPPQRLREALAAGRPLVVGGGGKKSDESG